MRIPGTMVVVVIASLGLQAPAGAQPAKAPPAQQATSRVVRIVQAQVVGEHVIVTLAAGSDDGIERSWRGQVLAGDSSTPLPGGTLELVRVERNKSIARSTLSLAVITANARVQLAR